VVPIPLVLFDADGRLSLAVLDPSRPLIPQELQAELGINAEDCVEEDSEFVDKADVTLSIPELHCLSSQEDRTQPGKSET
jgi:hypothetical protein